MEKSDKSFANGKMALNKKKNNREKNIRANGINPLNAVCFHIFFR